MLSTLMMKTLFSVQATRATAAPPRGSRARAAAAAERAVGAKYNMADEREGSGEHVEGSESVENQLAAKVKSKHVTLTHFTFPAGERERSAAKILIGVVVGRFTISPQISRYLAQVECKLQSGNNRTFTAEEIYR